MIRPPPAASIVGSAAWTSTNWATALAISLVCNEATGVSMIRSMLPGPVCTALSTSTSSRPKVATTVSTAAVSEAKSLRSATSGSA